MASPPSAAAVTSASWQAWRIADGRFAPFSEIGAALIGGRWNSPGQGVIYASRSFAGAMLECLAHAAIGRVPKTHVAVGIEIAGDIAVERRDETLLPVGWDHRDLRIARAFGDAWLSQRRSAVLVVPSVVARKEANVLFNPLHPDFSRIVAGTPEPVIWDARLFARH